MIQNIFLKLHINSVGGEVSAAFSIVDTILTSEVPIHTNRRRGCQCRHNNFCSW